MEVLRATLVRQTLIRRNCTRPFGHLGRPPDADAREMRRPPDGLLHASGDLVGSLRDAQLRAAGAPMRPFSVADEVVLMTGTLWHTWANEALLAARLPVMQEVKLDRWLPEG